MQQNGVLNLTCISAGISNALALKFSPQDWKRVVELITVSAMYQQFAGGERMGAYPDSISQFEQRNPVYINPEDILVNVLALKGHDPDIKTSRIKSGHGEMDWQA